MYQIKVSAAEAGGLLPDSDSIQVMENRKSVLIGSKVSRKIVMDLLTEKRSSLRIQSTSHVNSQFALSVNDRGSLLIQTDPRKLKDLLRHKAGQEDLTLSIITVSYNSAQTIKETIDSVLAQTYKHIEYIIVDGKSTDGTVEIVESYGDSIHKFVSEEDEGLYHAINKGIEMASGDVVSILNSDDIFAHNRVVEHTMNVFEEQQVDSVYGDLKYVDPEDNSKVIRYWKSGNYKRLKFFFGWMPPHPTFFVRKSVYDEFGKFDLSITSAADYELMLRFLYKKGISAGYNPEVMVLMKMGGKSNASILNRLIANSEDQNAWLKNNLKASILTRYMKPLRKVPQFVSSFLGLVQ